MKGFRQKQYAKRHYAKCEGCARRYLTFFVGQRWCAPCAIERKRAARARIQPDLPLEGDAHSGV